MMHKSSSAGGKGWGEGEGWGPQPWDRWAGVPGGNNPRQAHSEADRAFIHADWAVACLPCAA